MALSQYVETLNLLAMKAGFGCVRCCASASCACRIWCG